MSHMIPHPSPAELQDELKAMNEMSKDELYEVLRHGLTVTAMSMLRMANAIKILEERGEDLSEMRGGWWDHIRLIAYGQLLPDVVVRFLGNRELINLISGLPMPEQKRLAAGGSVKLMIPSATGDTDFRMADPSKLFREQVHQVFARDHIRDEAEQVLFIDRQRVKKAQIVPDRVGELKIDKERGGVVVGKKFIPLNDLVTAVKVLQS